MSQCKDTSQRYDKTPGSCHAEFILINIFLFSIIIKQLLNMCLTNHFAYGQEALMSFFLAGKGVGVGLSLAMNKNDVVHEF